MEDTITVIFSDLARNERFRIKPGGTEFFRRGTEMSYSPVKTPGIVYAVSNCDMTVFPAPRAIGAVKS
jgi:hypothetical protein